MIDADAVVKAALAGVGTVYVEYPVGIVERVPCVVASLIDGESPWVGILERPRYAVEGWAASKRAAQLLAQSAVEALVAAARASTAYPAGRVNYVRVDSRPAPVDSGVKNIYRSVGTVTVSLRPVAP